MKGNSLETIEKGITLIALAITIIVILILAGVSIGLLLNNEGLFEKANTAASRYNESKDEELAFLQRTEGDLNKYNGINGEGTANPSITIIPTPEPTPALPAVGEEPPEEGWTIEQAKELVARDGLKAHLGEKVAYNPKAGGTWQIFYYDNEDNGLGEGYFGAINSLYLKRKEDTGETVKLSNYSTHKSSDDGVLMKKMNPLWAKSAYKETDRKEEFAVSWMCDPNVWKDYNDPEVAEYAIGGASLEMFVKAYRTYYDTTSNLICGILGKGGYGISYSGGELTDGREGQYFEGSIERRT